MTVQIIIGSTRPGRVGPQIADWLINHMPPVSTVDYEIVDIAEYNLPLFNEPLHPSMGQYQFEYTNVWSEKIKQGDAYVFLTPEYNAGYPASLKNAIDYLYHEWLTKPVIIASYGIGGGGSASLQLRQVAERLKMKPTATSPAFIVNKDVLNEEGHIADINQSFAQYQEVVTAAVNELIKS